MVIFNKVKEKKSCPGTPGKHPGNTHETPRKGAFTNVLHQRSGFRKKTSLVKVVGIFNKVKENKNLSLGTPGKHPGNTQETPRKGAFTNVLHQRSGFRKKLL